MPYYRHRKPTTAAAKYDTVAHEPLRNESFFRTLNRINVDAEHIITRVSAAGLCVRTIVRIKTPHIRKVDSLQYIVQT